MRSVDALLRSRRFAEAREAFDRALAISPALLTMTEARAMTFLGEGDLPGARASLKASASHVDPTALVAYLANYQDLAWVLDEPQRDAAASPDAERVRRRPRRMGHRPRAGLRPPEGRREHAAPRERGCEGLRGAPPGRARRSAASPQSRLGARLSWGGRTRRSARASERWRSSRSRRTRPAGLTSSTCW